jgi:hypothetical protein
MKIQIKKYASGYLNTPSLPGQMFKTQEELAKAVKLAYDDMFIERMHQEEENRRRLNAPPQKRPPPPEPRPPEPILRPTYEEWKNDIGNAGKTLVDFQRAQREWADDEEERKQKFLREQWSKKMKIFDDR